MCLVVMSYVYVVGCSLNLAEGRVELLVWAYLSVQVLVVTLSAAHSVVQEHCLLVELSGKLACSCDTGECNR